MSEVVNPFEYFVDTEGNALDNGRIYIGEPNLDAETNPKAIFSDPELTIPITTQPVRTVLGVPYVAGAAAKIYTDGAASITVRQDNDVLVYSGQISDGGGVTPDPNTPTGSSFESLENLLASNTTYANIGSIDFFQAGSDIFTLKDESATDHFLVTDGGLKINYADGHATFLATKPRPAASNRHTADTLSADLSDMVGYAVQAGVTGGGGGTIFWVTNGLDSAESWPTGSLRWAVEQVRAAGSGRVLFDPRRKIDVVLLSTLDLPPNITIDAPGRNASIYRPGDVTGVRVGENNTVIRRLKFGRVASNTANERDAITVEPENMSGYWIDQCTFEDNSDGCIDIAAIGVVPSNCLGTMQRCLFRNHDKVCLMGGLGATPTDTIRVFATFHECWFDHCTQRAPKAAQQSFAHMVNCYFTLTSLTPDTGIVPGPDGVRGSEGGEVRVEDCWFQGSGGNLERAVYADLGGRSRVINSYAIDGATLTETDPSGVTVPPYTITKTNAVVGQAGRLDMLELVSDAAGSEVNGYPEGDWVFDATSTAEPNGVWVRGLVGSAAGRFFRQGGGTFSAVPTDATAFKLNEDTGVGEFLYGFAAARSGTVGIVGGTISPGHGFHTISPQSGNTDDLDTINFSNVSDGQRLVLMNSSSGNVITLRHGVGNIRLDGGTNLVLSGADQEAVELMWADFAGVWVQLH